MKQIYYHLIIFFCLIGLAGLTSYASTSYTVQVIASKTPTNINWFSAIHNLELPMHEFRDDGWYKYVIGEFKDRQEASNYISRVLASKGLQNSFPRILTDSLKLVFANAGSLDTVPLDTIIAKADSTAVKDTTSSLPAVSLPMVKTQRRIEKGSNKYGPWAALISMKRLHRVEIAIIEGAKPLLPRSFIPFYEKMIDKAIRYPIILFFIMLIFLFILNAMVIIIILELTNTIKNRLQRYDELYTNMYERALTGYIFQEYNLESIVPRIKKIRRSRNRRIFISVLFNFKTNLSGDLEQKLLDIFFRMGLEKDSMRKTHSHSFYRQILGIRELTNLYPAGAFPIVEMHVNDPNDELRAEAQTSYVRLNQEEPFRFLSNLRKPFTQWTQLTSFYIFRLHKLPAPSFVEYLNSDLYNVQNFSLRMIIYFQQKENAGEIIKLLYAEREMTRFLAIRAINELGIHEAKPLLKEIYERETYKNRIEIIKGFLYLGDTGDFSFLENIISQNDVTLKIEACRSMYFMNVSGMEYLKSLKLKPELNIEPYIAHIYDPRN